MAMKDEIREQRKSLKGKGLKACFAYFWEYYKWTTLAVIVGTVVVINLIVHFVTAKDQMFGAVFLNSYAEEPVSKQLRHDYAEYAGISLSQYEVMIDMNKYLEPGNQAMSYSNMGTLASILANSQSGLLDAIVANGDNFIYYKDSFGDLRDIFTEEELKRFSGKIYYIDGELLEAEIASEREALENGRVPEADTEADAEEAKEAERRENFLLPDPEEMGEPIPVGILLNDAPWIMENHLYEDTAVLVGVIAGTGHPNESKAFIEYLEGGADRS